MTKANVNGVNIDYDVCGQGEPLVLIQGLGGPRSGWIFQTRAFSKYYRVITFDNRGVGKSDKPSQPYTVRTMADDTRALLDHLGVDKAHVLGASLGGMVAQEMAISYPDRVMKLILACTAAGMGPTNGTAVETVGHGSALREADITDPRSVDMGRVMSEVMKLSFNKRLSKMFFVPLSKTYLRFREVQAISGQLEAAMAHSTLDRLDQIKAPTLVIVGTGDRLIPSQSSEMLANMIPGARLVKLNGGSHAFFMEMRGRFNKEVLDFLRGR
jgi:3-oxoadipate enol-lactonase